MVCSPVHHFTHRWFPGFSLPALLLIGRRHCFHGRWRIECFLDGGVRLKPLRPHLLKMSRNWVHGELYKYEQDQSCGEKRNTRIWWMDGWFDSFLRSQSHESPAVLQSHKFDGNTNGEKRGRTCQGETSRISLIDWMTTVILRAKGAETPLNPPCLTLVY